MCDNCSVLAEEIERERRLRDQYQAQAIIAENKAEGIRRERDELKLTLRLIRMVMAKSRRVDDDQD